MGQEQVGRIVRVSAVVLRDDRGAVLTVRKRCTERFMFPGGKPEPGETAEQTAVREVAEELAVDLDPSQLQWVGVFKAAAANEPDCEVEATVYEHPLVAIGQPSAEIEEVRWQFLRAQPYPDDLAPLLAHHVFPVLLLHHRLE